MSPQLPVSIHAAASALLEWLEEQPSSKKAIRARLRVHPDCNTPLTWLCANYSSQKLFFRSREQSFELAAFGFAHIAAGPTFTQQVHSSLVSILNPDHPDMRFYGACRFDSSEQSLRDPEWLPYNGFTFVIPAVELYRDSHAQFFLAANYIPSSDPSLLRDLLRRIAATPLSLQTVDTSFVVPRAEAATDLTSFPEWDVAMSTILQQLSSSQYDKIVLARRKRFSFPSTSAPDPIHVIGALDEQNREKSNYHSNPIPGRSKRLNGNGQLDPIRTSYLFCLQLDGGKAFVGCTPECLFFLKDKEIWTEALAGTVRRGAEGNEEEVVSELLNEKNLEEHRFVVDYIRTALYNIDIHVETKGPQIRKLPRLMHLATHIHGEIAGVEQSDDDNVGSGSIGWTHNIFKVLDIIHPTPAVCGIPQQRALTELRKLEDFDRGLFSGPLGWFSCEAGEFCVAIRSALIDGCKVTAFAGCGIVTGSESKSEWEETELKMSAFTDLFTVAHYKSSEVNKEGARVVNNSYN